MFGNNLTARKANKSAPHQNACLTEYLRNGALHPDSVEVFADAFKRSRYNFFQKQLLSLIFRVSDGSRAPSEDHEFTDWGRVVRFAERFAQQLGNDFSGRERPVD